MSYHYHVFASYCWRASIHGRQRTHMKEWVCSQLLPLFNHYASVEIPTRPGRQAMFADSECRTGPDYRETIALAHKRSAIIMPVLEAEYFTSDWCRVELDAFLARQRTCRGRPIIFPIYYSKNRFDEFDDDLRYRLPFDMASHAILYNDNERCKGYLKFQKRVHELVVEVGKVLKEAPPFDDNWPLLTPPVPGPPPPPPPAHPPDWGYL